MGNQILSKLCIRVCISAVLEMEYTLACVNFCSHLNCPARFNRPDLQVEFLPNGIFRATTGPESTRCLGFPYLSRKTELPNWPEVREDACSGCRSPRKTISHKKQMKWANFRLGRTEWVERSVYGI